MFQLFSLLSIMDYITPTKGFVEDVINDPTPFQSNSWTFFVPYGDALGSGWSASDIGDLLAKHGIKTWGSQITGGDLFFSLKLDQAGWAEYVLLRYGVPLAEHSMSPPRPKRAGRDKPLPEMNNSFQTGSMVLVPAPSIWQWLASLSRFVGRVTGWQRS